MTSQTPFDIHPLNAILFVMIAIVMIISFVFLILTESEDEKHYCDDYEPAQEEVEEIYETVEQLRTKEDCFGPEAASSLEKFNAEEEEWGGEMEEESEDSKQLEEHLPDVLLLVKMPYSRACDMLKHYNSDQIQFYGFHQENPARSRSQSI
jgi:hypothetical protein